jgi:hypothetical protein
MLVKQQIIQIMKQRLKRQKRQDKVNHLNVKCRIILNMVIMMFFTTPRSTGRFLHRNRFR